MNKLLFTSLGIVTALAIFGASQLELQSPIKLKQPAGFTLQDRIDEREALFAKLEAN